MFLLFQHGVPITPILQINFKGPTNEPECLVRVSKMTGKPVTFYEANLCDRESLRVPFRKVIDNFFYALIWKANFLDQLKYKFQPSS